MARARNIKPGFFKNEELAECHPLARILFAGLWCASDREGRLEDRPKRLKAEYLPYDDCDVDVLLTQLAAHGFIVRYAVEGVGYIAIPTFGEHQNPHVKEPASRIPAPDKSGASPVQVRCKSASGPADSLLLIPDSPSLKVEQAAKEPRSRGTRLPQDWQPSPADLDFIARERPDLDPQNVAACFRDFWHAKTGQNATKADWGATWRVWVRRQDSPRNGRTGPPKGHGVSKTGAFLQSLDAAIDQLENDDGEVVSIGNRAGPAFLAGPGA